MRHIFILILFFSFINANCQIQDAYQNPEKNKKSTAPFYVGLSSGIDNFVGLLGVQGEYNFFKNTSVMAGIGAGSWGTKMSTSLNYYFHYPKGTALSFGYSYSSGAPGIEFKLEAYDTKGIKSQQNVILDLYSTNNINLSMYQYFMLGKVHRFHLEFGYSVKLDEEPYKLKSQNVVLTDISKTVLNITQPGGLIIAFGFTFGIR